MSVKEDGAIGQSVDFIISYLTQAKYPHLTALYFIFSDSK